MPANNYYEANGLINRLLWFCKMKSPLFLGMLFLMGCVSTEQRAFDCAIGQPTGNWSQVYPSSQEVAKYKEAISAANKAFDPKKTTFWYQSTSGDIFACSLMLPYRDYKKYSGGCFTNQYLIKRSTSGEPKATVVGEIVCT